MTQAIQSIVIVGGGTAGWMAAAALSHFLRKRQVAIHLIESPDIGTIGVGEATLPGIRDFNLALGIDEIDFIKETQATFKLGIEFVGWKNQQSDFFHPFSNYGQSMYGADFYQVWQHLRKQNKVEELSHYCLSTMLATQGRFAQPRENPQTPLAEYNYAFHFDASLYADYLRKYAVKNGVIRHEKTVTQVTQTDTGFIAGVTFNDATSLTGDLFIDCSGTRGLLIEETLQTGFEDWSYWLPVNSAAAVQSKSAAPPTPYTKSIAMESGWRWRIPLQHRVGNGYVYCDDFISDIDAKQHLLDSLDGQALSEPRTIKFKTGRRNQFWHKNCIAVGLSSGFLEPLESTSISLIQTAISKLIMFFPDKSFNQTDIDEANRQASLEMEHIRDFILLHYKLSERTDTEFWRHIQSIKMPASLEHKINVFKRRGYIVEHEGESFKSASWISMYNGFDVMPNESQIKLDHLDMPQLEQQLKQMATLIQKGATAAPLHQEFISRHCSAPEK